MTGQTYRTSRSPLQKGRLLLAEVDLDELINRVSLVPGQLLPRINTAVAGFSPFERQQLAWMLRRAQRTLHRLRNSGIYSSGLEPGTDRNDHQGL